MHYGETEHRSIYGEASPKTRRRCTRRGSSSTRLPVLPDERN